MAAVAEGIKMQQIKFRGHRIYDKKWIYGNLVIDSCGRKHIVPFAKFYEDGHHLKYDDETDEPVLFDEKTIGQFLGVYDDKGTEVYAGDVAVMHAKAGDWKPKKIWWNPELGMYMLGNSLVIICKMEASQMTVIGTVYDNHELTAEE
jgi:hypothetical protein